MCLNTSFLKVICHSKYLLALRVTMFCSILNIVDFWSSLKPICIQPVSWITLKAYFIKLDFQFDNHWTRSIYFEISYLSGKVLHVFEKIPIILLLKATRALWLLKKLDAISQNMFWFTSYTMYFSFSLLKNRMVEI